MSWEPILNNGRPKASRTQVDIAVGCSKAGRQRPYCFVLIRGETLDQSPWIELDRTVDVLQGTGEHAGMVRVIPGLTWIVGKPMAGRRAVNTVTLRFYPPFSMPPQGVSCSAVEFDLGADWLEFTLPAWAKAKVPATPVKPAIPAEPIKPAAICAKPVWPVAKNDMAHLGKKERRA